MRISNGSHGTEAVKCAAEHDHQHARIAAFGAREFGKLGPRKQGAGADQCLAAARQVRAGSHCHLLWNSADMNSSASACWRALRAGHGLMGFGRDSRCQHRLDD